MRIEEAYAAWSGELIGYASALVGPHDAADVVADAFAGVLSAGDDRWAAVVEPRPFLFRCVLNAARMRQRSSSRRSERQRRVALVGGTDASRRSDSAGRDLVDPAMLEVLDSLSVQQRAVTYFTYWQDLSVDQIADLLEVSSGSVKKQLARARARMREVLS